MVEVEVRGHLAVITLNRPEARNAINGAVAAGVEAALDRLDADPELWLGVLAAKGPVFCAGADLKAINAGDGASLSTERGGFGGLVRRTRAKPLIAAVDGAALAGGCELALACDLIVASRAARFGLPEVKRSLVAAAGGLFRLPRALPEKIAIELVMTGEPLDAERAYHFGLVNRLVDAGQALDAALALGEQINQNAPLAVRASWKVARRAHHDDDDTLWNASFAAFGEVAGTEDFREGPLAFIEKRPPAWKGR